MRLPEDACSFWQRAQIRDIDERGFGYSPSLSEDEATEQHERELREDAQDPPCGTCECCEGAAAEEGP